MNEQNSNQQNGNQGWLTRERVAVLTLIGASILTFYLCYLLIEPFLPPLAWALALAVVANPLHDWIAKRVKNRTLAASLTVVSVAIVIILPLAFVMQSLIREAATGVQAAQDMLATGRWRQAAAKAPFLTPIIAWIEGEFDLPGLLRGAATGIASYMSRFLSGSVTLFVGLMITFFSLFFFFRDRELSLKMVRSIVPLSEKETRNVFKRVTDTIFATVYGTLAVSMIQGLLGGLMFWWLGLPAPVLWGFVMGLLGVVPMLGAFVVWIPAAILLALEGEWTKAIILTAWGAIIVALVDNILYPIFIGKRIRLHTLPIFFSILGGLAAFGASGLIIGPVVLSVADALLHIWRQRTAHGHTAEEGA